MRDLAIVFNGPDGNTYIDLNNSVEDKNVTAQKVLINVVTVKGSDSLYENKGTDLMQSCIGAAIINNNAMQHIANFAAVSTLYFINDTDGLAIDDPIGLADVYLKLQGYNAETSTIALSSTVGFPDGTKTETPNIIQLNNV